MKSGKIIFQVVKMLIIIVSISYIAFKVYSEKQSGLLFIEFESYKHSGWLPLLAVILLMPVNWFLESVKFKLLVKHLQNISIYQSIKAVLAGITVSIFTPKRIGDFGGRIFILETKNRASGIFATLLGSLSQLLITLIIGGALFHTYLSMGAVFSTIKINLPLLFLVFVVVIIAVLTVYFNISKFAKLISRFAFFTKHIDFIMFVQKYNKTELFYYLLISFLRYSVFSLQFFLLLQFFGVEIPFGRAIVGISQIYLMMVLIPSFALGELGVRGSIAVWILSSFTTFASGIIAASVLLWIVNLAIPALLGTYYLSKLKY